MKNLLLLCCLSATLAFTATVTADSPLHIARLDTGDRAAASAGTDIWKTLKPGKLKLRSAAALVVDEAGNEVYAKQENDPMPIASITKLMTAMVILDGDLPMQEKITITRADRDLIQLTGSRLEYGARLSRGELLQLALMASENRAANALARTWPGGRQAFIAAMNRKAQSLHMQDSRFSDPAGLDAGNVASARELVKMVRAAMRYPFIRKATTTRSISVRPYRARGELRYVNTNRLLKNKTWEIQLSKTGYLNEAGRCLAMQAEIVDHPLTIVLLNSFGKLTPFGDSNRIRKWIEGGVGS
jgi:D-alanyl-D-alanine endopeptidase (penicillin-binding protein 7)